MLFVQWGSRIGETVHHMAERDMLDVECDSCGVRINLDSCVVTVKHRLHKPVECPICRNARISKELEQFKIEFSGAESAEEHPAIRRSRIPSANQSFF